MKCGVAFFLPGEGDHDVCAKELLVGVDQLEAGFGNYADFVGVIVDDLCRAEGVAGLGARGEMVGRAEAAAPPFHDS